MELESLLYKYEKFGASEVPIDKIVTLLKENEMATLYKKYCEKFQWNFDQDLFNQLTEKNTQELQKIENSIEEAITKAGDTEVIDGMFDKARYLLKIGHYDDSLKVYDEILRKDKVVTSKKIDVNMEKSKIYLILENKPLLKDTIQEAKKLNELGGDWDRRNRLKVYEALYFILINEVKEAAALLADCIATFNTVELCDYNLFLFYTLILNLITMKRSELKKKIIDEPNIISALPELPTAPYLVSSLYNCDYKSFFENILKILPEIDRDRFLGPLASYLIREFRVLAYSQFLEAYKSVMFSSMATSFGITPELLDKDLSRFISSGRVSAKIDKINGVILSRKYDEKNSQYNSLIKKGDNLLNNIQLVVRAMDL